MRVGRSSGCHQMPERSFFIKGKQFPVCARCTGVMIGKILAIATFWIYAVPIKYYICGCEIMFLDWFLQYMNVLNSTNVRRLITGILGGYSVLALEFTLIKYAIGFLMKGNFI